MFAARAFDPTIHGGFIAAGEPTVLVGGAPAARVGDPHVCPLNPPLAPHVGGWVANGSASVLIGGQFASRQGDLCACCVAPVSLGPPAGEPPPPAVEEDAVTTFEIFPGEKIELGYSKVERVDKKSDGFVEEHKAELAAERTSETIEVCSWLRFQRDDRVAYWEGGYRSGKSGPDGESNPIGGAHEAGYQRKKRTVVIGDDANPLWKGEFQGKNVSASAGGESFLGTDGSRYGAMFKSSGGAALASGDATVSVDAALVPVLTPAALAARKYLGINAELSVSAGVSAESAGGGVGAYLYYEDGRIYAGLGGEAAAAIGLEADVGLSMGVLEGRRIADAFRDSVQIDPELVRILAAKAEEYFAGQRLASVPNTIAIGCPTVMIGG